MCKAARVDRVVRTAESKWSSFLCSLEDPPETKEQVDYLRPLTGAFAMLPSCRSCREQ